MPVRDQRTNRLLSLLPDSDYERLRPHFSRIVFDYRKSLYEASRPIEHVYFPIDGVASLVITTADGASAEVGTIGNEEHELISWGKAGKTRWKGRRPKVRGEVMNPVDHPHGGRTRGGRNVVSPWGKKEGVKTRNKKKSSQRLIVRGRKRGKATQ